MRTEGDLEQATFAAGCFWGVEAAFRRVKGVVETWVGYTGGNVPDPTYEQVCSGTTGHAEAVRVVFDPRVVTYDQLLEVFWEIHDPTQKDGQGPDVGTNYRSAIFYHSDEQRAKALASRERLQNSPRLKGKEIVTEILPAGTFWKAEDHHQQFYEKCGWGYAAAPKYWE
ncbi:MAG: peptide-methionine (S)-S-oxide reductase MsrA [Methanolinea sp.]